MLTNEEIEKRFKLVISQCHNIFSCKLADYGPAWVLYRDIALADQIWMKIKRIRTIEEAGTQTTADSIESEFAAIINYGIIAIMRVQHPDIIPSPDKATNDSALLEAMDYQAISRCYTTVADELFALYQRKNHDYGNAWQDFAPQTITDLIVIKTMRVKNILQNRQKPTVSEDIDGQIADIVIYSVFALIKKDM